MSTNNTQETEQLIVKLLKKLERKGRNIKTFLWQLMDQFDEESFDEKNDENKFNINNQKITILYNPAHRTVCKVGHYIHVKNFKHLSIEPCIMCGHRNNNNQQKTIKSNNNKMLQFLKEYDTNQIPFGPLENQTRQITVWKTNGNATKWPLHYAAITGDIVNIKQISNNKYIDIDQKMTDWDDVTPIALAAEYGQLESLIELIKNGANCTQPPDRANCTPYKSASYWKHKAIVVFFQEYIKYLYNFEINNNNTNLECFKCYNYDLNFNQHLINGTMTKYVYCKNCALENVKKVKQTQENNQLIERRIIKTINENASISVDTLCQMKDAKSLHTILKEIMVSGEKHAYWLWLLDIDNFKTINTHLTHAIADTKIQAVGQVLKKFETRTWQQWKQNGYDGLFKVWAFRQGGDEFALVTQLVTQKRSALQTLYERVRNDIHEIKLENMTTMKHITVSIGACHGQGIDHYQEIMKKADEAAETVKKNGKNGITICTPWHSRQKIWKNFNDIR